MINRLTPDLDRNDKFMAANSVYRLAYFSYHQAQLLTLFLSPLAILPPVLEARTGVDTALGLFIVSIVLSAVTALISKFFGGYFLEKLKSKFKDKPHIRHADVRINLALIPVSMLFFLFIAFGLSSNPIITGGVLVENLLHKDASYGSTEGLIQSSVATALYASIVFISVSSFLRGVSVGYHYLRLR